MLYEHFILYNLFKDATRFSDHIALNAYMIINNKLESMWKEYVITQFKVVILVIIPL
jgi:hypothetical protein